MIFKSEGKALKIKKLDIFHEDTELFFEINLIRSLLPEQRPTL